MAELGRLPADDGLDEEAAQRYTDAIDGLQDAPTADEASALIRVLPPDDSTAFGLAWGILHAIEASPAWPLWTELDDRNWWVRFLRERCERGGLTPPD